MLCINKITTSSVVDHAAEELKKYLRMMMPESGDIKISYAPEAKNGFRLGLMQDLGLDVSDAENPELDDILYIDCNSLGGVIAGDNPRSVLLAVYEYLRQNGCRWLMPGVDGEYIPMKDIGTVKYRHKAAMRYRGNCIEGAVRQSLLSEFIDFMPKVGLNTFMIQFRIPTTFYNYYHRFGKENTPFSPDPVSREQVLMWTRLTECEMAKRGIMLHSCGHGWTNDPFGIDSCLTWKVCDDEIIPKESRSFIALLGDRRGFFGGRPANTQFCMSNERARRLIVDYIANYAETHSNTDFLHVWLADGQNNHCECEDCRMRNVSDWYMILLNEIDAALTERKLKTRIVYIVYEDTTWAPKTESLKNPKRFTMMIAPITRDYSVSLAADSKKYELRPYVRNKLKMTESLDEYLLYVNEWKKINPGEIFAFEYHFWRQHAYDLSGNFLAERIYEDIAAYTKPGAKGMLECGTERAFFPNGYAHYVFARAMFDSSLSLSDIKEDYFSHAYGDAWKKFYAALDSLCETIPFKYLSPDHARQRKMAYIDPTGEERVLLLNEKTRVLRSLISENYNSDIRVRTVSVRLLEDYAEYVDLCGELIRLKSLGLDDEALSHVAKMRAKMAKREARIERYCDSFARTSALTVVARIKPEYKLISTAEGN